MEQAEKEPITINILPFLIEALSIKKSIRKDIDMLYESDKYKFYKKAKESEWYNNLVVKEGDIYREVYAKKALGIILCANKDNNLAEKFLQILKKGWPRAYSYVKKHDNIDIEQYMVNLNSEIDNMHIDIFNSELAVLYFLSVNFNKNFIINEGLKVFEENLLQREKHYLGLEPSSYSFDKLPDETKKHAADLRKQVYSAIGEISTYKILFDSKVDVVRREIDFMSFLFDSEKLSMDSLFFENDINKKDVIEIFALYYGIFKDMDVENAIKHFVSGTIIKCLLKAYKQVKTYFFEHNQETMFLEMERRDEEIEKLKSENDMLKNKISELSQTLADHKKSLENKYLQEIKMLNKTVEDLKMQLDKEHQKDKELNALRDFMFSLDTKEAYSNFAEDTDFSSVKGLIVGGHEIWQKELKKSLPNFSFINSENFDIKVLDNIDIVFFFPNFLSHALYYRVINEVRKRNIKVGYISKLNKELALEEIKRQV
ncbi:hypothetical protein [Thermoanaerobacterium thermosaccharolyticum]|uniref:hypothetical protein n=1 Tax=Thermoanaerobacterium thermosaccharolyticum TaxID=1517 RepID=UPI001783CEF3|nr:hypothetical protein [Thermoanaerobacterium thermosaccharolyticum]MBE0069906.1 hypothetical protein [Thermoanaerobacterium thermosaccharolyticum]MBE0228034.1 hypothetical protein [Thermoanaerobacterium thermosaccharolyticum]